MPTTSPRYNERSWAIDVITEINQYCALRTRAIVRAGGEYTLSGQAGSLFPDVLLFGDKGGSIVQQGWELKMPDTPITDTELIQNAELKARRLGLNSFLLWNADEAVLYLKTAQDVFEPNKTWPRTNISRRADVYIQKTEWIRLLHQIIDDINGLLERQALQGATPSVAISNALFLDYLNVFTSPVSDKLQHAYQRNASFAAETDLWWEVNKLEHPDCSKYEGLARVNIISWINRFLFAHYLKRFHAPSVQVETINHGTTITQAIAVFESISAACDFMNVFHHVIGQESLDSTTWSALVDLNKFLTDFKLENISQESFHQVIEGALSYSRKKLAGQFSTPKPLAELLVRIGIENRISPIIDPCCGTGTIARAAYDLKRQVGLPIGTALSSTWGSDKFAFPLQLCSIALSDPLGMGEVIQVFRHDALELSVGEVIVFTNPTGGTEVERRLPEMHAVISNLPFVRFEKSSNMNPLISRCAQDIHQDTGRDLSTRADLYAYLLLQLRHLVTVSGRLSFIVSNSWLGTDWGQEFRQILLRYFKVIRVVISGSGRWFSNSDVVTTIVILEKRPSQIDPPDDEFIEFITTTNRIEDWATTGGGVDSLANAILASVPNITGVTKFSHTISRITQLESIGLGWPSFFVNLDWVAAIENNLVPMHNSFEIKRGERRGWDALFYPQQEHGVESRYIRPVLMSSRDIDGLIARADKEAFCCPDDLTKLQQLGMRGTLAWIRRFQHESNGTGRPLPEVLARAGHHWYEMSPSTLADFVIPMNPDKRLCVHRLAERSFVNQRLIRLTTIANSVDLDLCHALMNSIIGMFFIEASGFGRGLGALDLNASKLSANLHMLNPAGISPRHRNSILTAFGHLLLRNVLELPAELASHDRIAFDSAVLSAFGISHLQDTIYASLLQLFNIRQTARNNV